MKRIHVFPALAVLAVAALSQVPRPAGPGRAAPFPGGPPNFCDKSQAKAYEAALYGPLDRALPPPIDGANPPWECIGPEGGNIVGLDYDRSDERKLFVAIHKGGVYRSSDSGDSWVRVQLVDSYNIGIAVDPTDAQKLYVLNSGGVRRSWDGGATWQTFYFPANCWATCGPLVDPAAPNTLYGAGFHYYNYPDSWNYCMVVLKSTNGGQNWSYADLNPTVQNGQSSSLAMSPSSPNVLYIGGYEYTNPSGVPKIYKSINGGADWADVTGTVNAYPYSLAVHPLDPNQVFAGTWSNVFRSFDGGASWAASNGYVNAYELAVDPHNPNVLYAGASGSYKSVDGGVNWTWSSTGLMGLGQDLKVAAGAVFMVGTAGVFRSDDGGLTWHARNSSLRGTIVPALAVAPSQPETIYIEAEEYSLLKTLNAGASWQPTTTPGQCGRHAKLVAHPTDAEHVYFLSGDWDNIYRSVDGASNWMSILTRDLILDFIVDPANPSRISAAGQVNQHVMGGFLSTDGGSSWADFAFSWRSGEAYAVTSPSADPNTVYVGGIENWGILLYDGAVYKTANGGASWNNVGQYFSGLVYALAADLSAAGTVYAGTYTGIYKTSNGGASWSKTGSFDVNVIVPDPDAPGWVYAAGYNGVYASADFGLTWFALNNSLPAMEVLWLDLDRTNDLLYAGTVEAVWRVRLPSASADISGTVTAGGSPLADVTLTFSNGGGTALTNASGQYVRTVSSGWSGTASPSKVGYIFTPPNRSYTNVSTDQTGQNYTAVYQTVAISGTVLSGASGLSGVVMTGLPGNPATDGSGAYSANVGMGWSGTVWPMKSGFTFSPLSRSYASLSASQAGQDFEAAAGPAFETSSGPIQILPEVVWSSATGGGTWMTEIQVTDVTGGSAVQAWFNTAGARRGPLTLMTGTPARGSVKFANILLTLQALDRSFTYYGRVGALELHTQGGDHRILAAARTVNGVCGKTFPGLSDTGANAACLGMDAAVQNLASTSAYRSFVGAFNPADTPVTVEFSLHGTGGEAIGPAFSRTFAAHDFQSFNPFNESGRSYPTYSYSNAWLRVRVTEGSGRLFVFGASASNSSNDPAAHPAVSLWPGWSNSPQQRQVLPEVIWAPATGGGTWVSEVQVTDLTGGSAVEAYFYYGSGVRRGPVALWTGTAAGASHKTMNLLQVLQTLDPSFTYSGRVGAVELVTQDANHLILASARTVNGVYGKTFPGINDVAAKTAEVGRELVLQNLTNNASYRSSVGCFNPDPSAVAVRFRLIAADGSVIGEYERTLAGWDFVVFNPFTKAGIPYPRASHDNVWLEIAPTSGAGRVIAYGASAHNVSNDPAAHIAVQLR